MADTTSSQTPGDGGRVRPGGRAGGFLDRSRFSARPALLSLPLAILAAVLGRFAFGFHAWHYEAFAAKYPAMTEILPPDDMPAALVSLAGACAGFGAFLLLASLAALIRRRWALWITRKGYVAVYALLVYYAYVVFQISAAIEADKSLEFNAISIFYLRYEYLWLPTLVAMLMAIGHLGTWLRRTINLYTACDEDAPAAGDLLLEDVRTNGRDPLFRKSWLTSAWAHLMVLVIIPWLLQWWGCVDPYKIPWGGGKPQARVMLVQRVQKKKKRRKYILRTDAPIIFEIPDLDDSKIIREVEEQTQVRYTADATAVHGQMGDGDASTPGWQDGFKDGIVRFVRLEYRGEAWDDGMDARSRADLNFLDKFRELSGGVKTADYTESYPTRLLKRFPEGMAPPFVYMTGEGTINMSRGDIKILREYINEGGMLFADCGSARWHGSFMGFARLLFPDKALIPIADDDPLFQIPFGFQHGAPPLWHHGGDKAMGIKHQGRWVVFYHPGDINDAWKTGHSGLDSEKAQGAFYMGINIVYHSFMNYLRETRKLRK